MLRDARTVEPDATLDTDVCIIGAGPAGMTLAFELMRADARVLVLEAGDEEGSHPPRSSAGSAKGTRYKPLSVVRFEGFGGTSLDWLSWSGLRCLPLRPLDFERRPQVPHTGWPFGLDTLNPYYERAHAVLDLGACAYSPAQIGDEADEPTLPLDQSQVQTTLFRFAPRDVFRARRAVLVDSDTVTVMLRARAVEIETADSGQQVTGVRVRSDRGRFLVAARVFVLAAGGIENPRLLLASNRDYGAGLGNGHDLVGRFFMEHLVFKHAQIVPASSFPWGRLGLYHRRRRQGVATLGAPRLSEDVQRREGLLGVVLSPFESRPMFFSQSVHALADIVGSLTAKRRPAQPLRKALMVLADPLPAARASYLRLTGADAATTRVLGIHAHFEQAPEPQNRVTLSDRRDRNGVPTPRLRWSVGDLERHSVLRTLDLVDEELRRREAGFVCNPPASSDIARFTDVTHHHMGTTRMHNDPTRGVVDENCRIHGISNLFVAGSSVFPTGGAATATLTLVALAIRLADHIKTRLPASPAPLVESHAAGH